MLMVNTSCCPNLHFQKSVELKDGRAIKVEVCQDTYHVTAINRNGAAKIITQFGMSHDAARAFAQLIQESQPTSEVALAGGKKRRAKK